MSSGDERFRVLYEFSAFPAGMHGETLPARRHQVVFDPEATWARRLLFRVETGAGSGVFDWPGVLLSSEAAGEILRLYEDLEEARSLLVGKQPGGPEDHDKEEAISATCKGCGKRIVWGVTPEGKKIPLDPVAPVYRIAENTGGALPSEAPVYRARGDGHDYLISHFATCPAANQFSGSRREP